jgi:hypothetical protein
MGFRGSWEKSFSAIALDDNAPVTVESEFRVVL